MRTKDDVLIVFHDYNMKELTGHDIEVSDANWNDIKNYKYFKTIHGQTYN